MTELEAIEILTEPDRLWMALDKKQGYRVALHFCAAAVLTGQLALCETPNELYASIAHFTTHLAGNVYTVKEWDAEAARIEQLLADWGRSVDAQYKHESN